MTTATYTEKHRIRQPAYRYWRWCKWCMGRQLFIEVGRRWKCLTCQHFEDGNASQSQS